MLSSPCLAACAGLLCLPAALVLGGPALAATPSIYPSQITPLSGGGITLASGDLNGDGIPDLVVGGGAYYEATAPGVRGGVSVLLGKKGGGYEAPVFYPTSCGVFPVALADLGNGHLDILAGGSCDDGVSPLSVFIGNGDGTFKPGVDYIVDPESEYFDIYALAVADTTGTGRMDVVLSTDGGYAYLIPGKGDGTLDVTAVQSFELQGGQAASLAVALNDVNGDGRPDIVLDDGWDQGMPEPGPQSIAVFLNQGNGQFDATASQRIAVGPCPLFGRDAFFGGKLPNLAVVDFCDFSVRILSNSSGVLTASPTPLYQWPDWPDTNTGGPRVADVDGDGAPDLLVPVDGYSGVAIFYGDKNGGFNPNPQLVPAGASTADVLAVKSGSGRLDLVSVHPNPDTGGSSLVITRNLGNRQFLTYQKYQYALGTPQDGQGLGARDMASADFNGDGKPDVVTLNSKDGTLSVLLNDGKGGFKAPSIISVTGQKLTIQTLAAGDVNGDGKADIVTADNTGYLYVYPGKGDGSFGAPIKSAIASGTVFGLALGDLDHDGKPDAVVAAYDSDQLQVCKGDGAGHFDCNAFAAVAVVSPRRVALADLTGNGKLDLIVTTDSDDATVEGATDAYVYPGNGDGSFAAAPAAALPIAGGGEGIAVGDVNSDGKPDLVFGSYGNSVSVFTGAGDGTFSASALYRSGITDESWPLNVALGDLNGDGKPDIVAANLSDALTMSVMYNNGDGSFAPAQHYSTPWWTYVPMIFDMDGDGLSDIVLANRGNVTPMMNMQVAVYLHLHAAAVTGTTLTVNQNQSGSGKVTAVHPEQADVSFLIVNKPAHGSVNLDAASGSFTYTPATGYSGSDSFTVSADDGINISAPGSVGITVKAVGSGSGPTSGNRSGGGGSIGLLGLLTLGLIGLGFRRRG